MSKALVIAFHSAVIGLVDRHHLDPRETVEAGLHLAVWRAREAGFDRTELQAALDAALIKGAPDIEAPEGWIAAGLRYLREREAEAKGSVQ